MNVDLEKFLEKLPDGLRAELVKIITRFAIWIALAQDLAVPVREVLGNSFLHALVKAVKMFNLDNPGARRLCLSWTVSLFDLPATWEPDWLFKDDDSSDNTADTVPPG